MLSCKYKYFVFQALYKVFFGNCIVKCKSPLSVSLIVGGIPGCKFPSGGFVDITESAGC